MLAEKFLHYNIDWVCEKTLKICRFLGFPHALFAFKFMLLFTYDRSEFMKKKKGFTLVELLAVIVILAIILIISVPLIINTINTSRLASFKSSAELLVTEAEKQYMIDQTERANAGGDWYIMIRKSKGEAEESSVREKKREVATSDSCRKDQ